MHPLSLESALYQALGPMPFLNFIFMPAYNTRIQTFTHTSARAAETSLLNMKKNKPRTGAGTVMSMICRNQKLSRMGVEILNRGIEPQQFQAVFE